MNNTAYNQIMGVTVVYTWNGGLCYVRPMKVPGLIPFPPNWKLWVPWAYVTVWVPPLN